MSKNSYALIRKFLQWSNFHITVQYRQHNGTTPRHLHPDYYELVFVRNGSGINKFDNRSFSLNGGNFFLIDPNRRHHYSKARELGIYNILFSRDVLDDFQQDLSAFPIFKMMFANDGNNAIPPELLVLPDNFFPAATALLDNIVTEQNERKYGAQTAILSSFLQVLLLLCRHGEPASSGSHISHACRISSLLAKLDTEFAKAWTLEKMAKSTGMSVSSFRQQFTALTDTPPAAYLLDLRLRKAASFLLLQNLSVTETAAMCGFNDSNYFTRQFKRKFDLPPRKFRDRARKIILPPV